MDGKAAIKINEIGVLAEGHLFYSTTNPDTYIENVLTFIRTGLKLGSFCLIIENDRCWLAIKKKLAALFSSEQLEKVIHINNFDFYCSTGEFHTETIISYFSSVLSPYLEANQAIRTWAHVEWGNDMDMAEKLKRFEQKAQETVRDLKILSVCAYDAGRLNDKMSESLLATHSYFLNDK